jgi:chaperonin GroES
MKFRPLHDRIVVKRIDAEEKTAGGIIIDLRLGDRVLFGKWSGTEVKIDGEELLIMKESDIMGVIEEGVAKRKAA